MTSLATIFDAFLLGRQTFAEIEVVLHAAVARDPTAASALRVQLDELYAAGRIPVQVHMALRRVVAPEAAPASDDGTGTRLKPAPADSAGTRLRPAVTAGRTQNSNVPWNLRTGATELPPRRTEKQLEPGVRVKHRFLLIEQIGQGGMGVVFKARDLEYEGHEQYVALKFLIGDLQGRPEALRALEQEVRKTHELAHPNIVTIYDFYRDDPFSFISMELLDGEPLDRLLRGAASNGLPFAQAWPIIEAAGTALAHAHKRGTIHSDFKPGNVFITRDSRVKVLDFGIARAARADSDEFDVTVLGGLTPAYASPEMVLNLEPDPRDDVYALACVAYELLSGRHPFDRTPAHRAQHSGMTPPIIKRLPRARMRALLDGLAFTRDVRTPSVERFLQALGGTTTRRWIMPASLTAAALVVAAAGSTVYLSSAQRCPALDAEFLRALSEGGSRLDVDSSYRDVLIEQGGEYLAEAEQTFDAALLTEGVSDAFGAFTNVLRIDPDNEVAARGIFRIIALYESEARRLLDLGDSAKSLEVAEYGLRVHPQHCGLNEIKARATASG